MEGLMELKKKYDDLIAYYKTVKNELDAIEGKQTAGTATEDDMATAQALDCTLLKMAKELGYLDSTIKQHTADENEKIEHFNTVQKCLLLIEESLTETSDIKDFFKYMLFANVRDALSALSHFDPQHNEVYQNEKYNNGQEDDFFIPPF